MGYGKVYIMGVGPGDYRLMTLKAAECIVSADVIVYDRLVGAKVLGFARKDAEMVYVGKKPDCHAVPQEGINEILVRKAQEGKTVARVKGGDPFMFGRGGEEAETLREYGIEYEIVPGVTSAIAVPAYAGIPVTHRDYASSLHIITGHEKPGKESSFLDYETLAKLEGTLVFLMGVKNLPEISANLMRFGKSGSTPAAIIESGTTVNQRVTTGTLESIAELAETNRVKSPAVTVIGRVAELKEKLDWFPRGTLAGRTVLVTRAREQASDLVKKIEELGGEAVEFPTIEIAEPVELGHFDRVLDRLGEFQWMVFTSRNGVDAFFQRMRHRKMDIRRLGAIRFCAVGSATAGRLEELRLTVDFIPDKYTAADALEGLAELLSAGDKVLLARADLAEPVLPKGFAEKGIGLEDLVVYRTVPVAADKENILKQLEDRKLDFITFTSSSTVRNLLEILGEENRKVLKSSGARVVCIGPVTAKTAVELGIEPVEMADSYTIEGLVRKLEELSH